MNDICGRHELKHHINYADFLQIKSRLSKVAIKDSNAKDGDSYKVRSLYFDNYRDKALWEKIDGVNQREKFRLRLYNDDTTFIRLEKKSKKSGMCYKQNTPITAAQCQRLLSGDLSVLKEEGDMLKLELYTKMQCQQLRPKNIVDYTRSAFIFPCGNVRVTLDSGIRASGCVKGFLNPNLVTVPIPGTTILEVKYDSYLPEIMRGMVALSGRQATAFSKYAMARSI